MKTISGKNALVTGAASGIGRAIALALAREGAALFLIDIDEANLLRTAQEAKRHGVEVRAGLCDLSDPAAIGAMVSGLLSSWDRLHILVNNAGIAYYGPMLAMSTEQWRRMMAINLHAPIELTLELMPTLLQAEDAHIVNVSSILGLAGWHKTTAYQTTKHGLAAFSAGLRCEYGDRLGVSTICPGLVSTPMIERLGQGAAAANAGERPAFLPWWIFTTPEKVAAAAIAAIKKNRGLVVLTPAARLLWRLNRLFPAATGLAIATVARGNWRASYRLVAASKAFDQEWYLAQYPDVRKAGVDPIAHYLDYGAVEGRDPSPNFDSDWYLAQYPDVRQAGLNPLVHYLRHGKAEGRQPAP